MSRTTTTPGVGSTHLRSWSAFARGATHVAQVWPSNFTGRMFPGGRGSMFSSAMAYTSALLQCARQIAIEHGFGKHQFATEQTARDSECLAAVGRTGHEANGPPGLIAT